MKRGLRVGTLVEVGRAFVDGSLVNDGFEGRYTICAIDKRDYLLARGRVENASEDPGDVWITRGRLTEVID